MAALLRFHCISPHTPCYSKYVNNSGGGGGGGGLSECKQQGFAESLQHQKF